MHHISGNFGALARCAGFVFKLHVKGGLKWALKWALKGSWKELIKGALKISAKGGSKKMPVAGFGIGALLARSRIQQGDCFGATLELASGIFSCVPGVGTIVSIGVDGAIVLYDFFQSF